MTRPVVIAIDGPAASGKTTLGRRLGERLNLPCLDTGLLYRAVARRLIDQGSNLADTAKAVAIAEALEHDDLAGHDLRAENVGAIASSVAALPEVRTALLTFQRNFAATPPGAVVVGRDIGTEVLPDACAKLFVDADVEIRAGRRFEELRHDANPPIFAEVLAELRERDRRDQNRAVAPLRAADDSVRLDTTQLTIEAAIEAALREINKRCGRENPE